MFRQSPNTWSESVTCVSVESLTGLKVKHDAGADIDRELLAGDVDVDDVSELCGDGTAAVNYRKT